MAKCNYNATLEYSANQLEFWLKDDAGEPDTWDAGTHMYIERADGSGDSQTFTATVSGDYLSVNCTPSKNQLYQEGDTVYDYENVVYEHIWSLKSGSNVYISGLMNLVEVAG